MENGTNGNDGMQAKYFFGSLNLIVRKKST